jgi:hypothetical protein
MGVDPVRFSFDGTPLEAPRGMTIGGALLANGSCPGAGRAPTTGREASSAASGSALTA